MRKNAREAVFKYIFAQSLGGDADDRFEAELYRKENLTEDDRIFAHRLITLIGEHKEELFAYLDEKTKSVPGARIFPADKAALLIALTEINYMEDVPNVVSVNEAVGLVRQYSTETSAGFVNGVLAGVINQ